MDFTGGFDSKDVIFSRSQNGDIESGGFNIDNLFLKLGMSPFHTLITSPTKRETHRGDCGNGNVSSLLFQGFAVPIGLLSDRNAYENKKNLEDFEEDEFIDFSHVYDDDDENRNIAFIDDDLYEKLLHLDSKSPRPKKLTRKNNPKLNADSTGHKKRKTKKHRKETEK